MGKTKKQTLAQQVVSLRVEVSELRQALSNSIAQVSLEREAHVVIARRIDKTAKELIEAGLALRGGTQ
jgi:hypothetical protein